MSKRNCPHRSFHKLCKFDINGLPLQYTITIQVLSTAHESDQLGESKKIYDEHIRKQLLEKSNKTSRQNTADL